MRRRAAGVPERGPVGAGTGGSVGKLHGREHATRAGIGYACGRTGAGHTVAALAVVNAFGDVIGADGEVLGGIQGGGRTADEIVALSTPPGMGLVEPRNTTLVCVMTDAPLDKPSCGRVARMASAGLARAVDPVFSDVDGDVCFCIASGSLDDIPSMPDALITAERLIALGVGTLAATVTAAGDPRLNHGVRLSAKRPPLRTQFRDSAGEVQDRSDRVAEHSLRRG